MDTIKNLQKVSLLFFITLGITHITANLMLANNYASQISHLIIRTFDIPFALSALCYGLSSLRLNLNQFYPNSKTINTILVISGVLSIIILIYINFFIIDL